VTKPVTVSETRYCHLEGQPPVQVNQTLNLQVEFQVARLVKLNSTVASAGSEAFKSRVLLSWPPQRLALKLLVTDGQWYLVPLNSVTQVQVQVDRVGHWRRQTRTAGDSH
jgi:hypothetical protein